MLANRLKVITDDQMEKVHANACRLLEEKGIVFSRDNALDTFRRHGAKVSDHTVFIPRKMVDDALSHVPQVFTLEAMNPEHNVTVGDKLLIHPAGGEVFVSDTKGNRRQALLNDFKDLQKLYQACGNIDIGGYQPLSPSDVPETTKGLWCILSSMQYCNKAILSPMELDTVKQKEECLELFNIAYGKENYIEDHYLTWHAVCPNSPFYYSDFACDGIEVFARHNQPVMIVSAPMSGITSPVYLCSTLVLSLAEMLAGLVYAQLLREGVPVIMSASLTYGNMRYATWECAAPDTALMLCASVQMFRDFYRLPARAQTGVTASKCLDYQAGMETMQSLLSSALAGANLTSQTVGTLGNLMISSLEKTVLDDEAIGRVRYILKGMDMSEEAFGMEELLKAEPCSDFLTADSTLTHLREGWQPSLSHWGSMEAWEAEGKHDVVHAAEQKVQTILEASQASLLDEEQEKEMLAFIKKCES